MQPNSSVQRERKGCGLSNVECLHLVVAVWQQRMGSGRRPRSTVVEARKSRGPGSGLKSTALYRSVRKYFAQGHKPWYKDTVEYWNVRGNRSTLGKVLSRHGWGPTRQARDAYCLRKSGGSGGRSGSRIVDV